MKKCINFFMLLVMVLALAGCGANDRMLKAQIENGKKHCPISLGMAGKLTSMSYDDSNREVKFVITLNKQVSDIKNLQADPESARQTMRLALQKGNMKQLLEMMVDAEASLNITYKNKGSKEEFVLNFSSEELKNILDNPMTEEETNKLMLQTQINSEKNRLPYKIEKGLNVVGIEDNGSSLVYVCEVDEDLYDIDEMGKAKEELKDNMRKMMKDRAMRQQAEILSSLNKGFEYKYVGKTSGKNVIVAFSSAELGEIVGKK
ncbi:MAG: hypothetical protein K2J82_12755 [Muribaculaceae bacterium]|nr:hypothetical protein [Muribaculaceae bacterium]